MLTILAVALIVPLCIAGYLYWRVNRDFFAALEAEYDFQLSRDPEHKKRRRLRRKPMGQRISRLARRGAYAVKRRLYLLAVILGVKRRDRTAR